MPRNEVEGFTVHTRRNSGDGQIAPSTQKRPDLSHKSDPQWIIVYEHTAPYPNKISTESLRAYGPSFSSDSIKIRQNHIFHCHILTLL